MTSGVWGHRTGLNLAYAFVSPALSTAGTVTTIDLLGDLVPATVIPASPYDPDFARVRA